jgi:CheY-like chemotaxis protein
MAQAPLVLIVDDEQALRELICDLLTDVGYRTATATNGAAAFDSMRCAAPDLILLDVAMPIMDGLTFLRRHRADQHRPSVPVVIMSAERREVEARQLGAAQFVSKPFDLDHLLSVIEHCLPPEVR